jgi:hypothetical protein
MGTLMSRTPTQGDTLMRTIFFAHTGPMVRYDGDLIHINDLNPEFSTRWRMSRWEMVKFGFKAIAAGIFGSRTSQPI